MHELYMTCKVPRRRVMVRWHSKTFQSPATLNRGQKGCFTLFESNLIRKTLPEVVSIYVLVNNLTFH